MAVDYGEWCFHEERRVPRWGITLGHGIFFGLVEAGRLRSEFLRIPLGIPW
jgi:hypothetical protein